MYKIPDRKSIPAPSRAVSPQARRGRGSPISIHDLPLPPLQISEMNGSSEPFPQSIKTAKLLPHLRLGNDRAARMKGYEERETQVYDCSLHGLRPASHC